jgi:FtsP/CotA-like multicopper oxidase with cupredoxin domain
VGNYLHVHYFVSGNTKWDFRDWIGGVRYVVARQGGDVHMTRRELLKYCTVAGGAILVSTKGPLPRVFADTPQSPPTTPFMDPLPVPASPLAVPAFALDADAAADVDRTQGATNYTYYNISVVDRSVHFHKQLPATPIWGYVDGNPKAIPGDFAPGPTFRGTAGSGIAVRYTNLLKVDETGFGLPQLTTHLHGAHLPSRSDGFPAQAKGTFDPVFYPGTKLGVAHHYDYTYPFLDPGFKSTPQADITERPSLLWYHDHILDFTGPNVYRGLSGLFPVFDNLDTGDETTGLRLPSGDCDIPMVIQDRMFAQDGSLVFDPLNHDGFLGDKFAVNGKIQPYVEITSRRYRLRFLNGSNARFYQLFLTDASGKSIPFTIIASEGGLLSRPVQSSEVGNSLLMSPALRFEIVVDFSGFKKGDKLYLENRLSQDDGRGPNGTFEQPELLSTGVRLVEFRVMGPPPPDTSDNSMSLDTLQLRPFNKISDDEVRQVKTIRQFEFDRSHGSWTINGQLVDLNQVMAASRLNDPEIWQLKNGSGGWWHPIHIHSEFSRVLSRNGQRPSPYILERDGIARKDTVILGPNSEVAIYIKFRDYAGPWVFHCHNIEHEDMAMMARFDVVTQPGDIFI